MSDRHADGDTHTAALDRMSNFDWFIAAGSFWVLSLGVYRALEMILFPFPPVIKYVYPVVMIVPAAFFGGLLVYSVNRAKIEAREMEVNNGYE